MSRTVTRWFAVGVGVFLATLLGGDVPQALEHRSMRWLGPGELHSVPWLPADKPIVAELPALLVA